MSGMEQRVFDPVTAREIHRDGQIKAAKAYPCDGDPTCRLGPRHRIKPGELYERTTMRDDANRTFHTYRVCHWCLAGEARVEEWIP